MKDYKRILQGVVNIINTTEKSDIGFANICAYIGENCPELKELKDERIRKAIIEGLKAMKSSFHTISSIKIDDAINWLEKQDKKPVPKFKVGDTVTVKPMSCHGKVFKGKPFKIVNIIEDNYVSDDGKTYSISLQNGWELIEWKPDNVEPKFKVGDWITNGATKPAQISSIEDDMYYTHNGTIGGDIESMDKDYHLWTIEDAKIGDVLANDISVFIYAKVLYSNPYAYCGVDKFGVFKDNCLKYNWSNGVDNIHPATKEQRGLLFQKMKEASYEWDAEKKELIKIEDENYNGEDYGIDSLFHAQRILEKTLGKVEGYQSDDGILEHKCAISAVKKLYEHKPAWSEEDNPYYDDICEFLINLLHSETANVNKDVVQKDLDWLTERFRYMKPNPKHEWGEEDIRNIQDIDSVLFYDKSLPEDTCMRLRNWLESLKQRLRE